jgi:serine/threonine-protein kinase PknK
MDEDDELPLPTLPADVSSFVGRRADRQDVRALLSDARLVTLTGVGGVGKTRLALRVAADLRRAFRDGVCFASLAAHNDPAQVPYVVASALGLQGRSERATTTSLVGYLQPRSMLIVLDNCEHVVDASAMLVDTLIRTCPDLRILATSREPLRIQGEAVHVVPPLSVPPAGTGAPLQQFDSITLFLDRARSAVPGFDLTADNREAVAQIVQKLEGLPLAIELASGRLRAMSPQEIAANLTERWELLSRGSRTAPDRQRTMAACITWSFDLCTPAEREIWARLSVFADGFELDAAGAVCGPTDEPVADVVAALVDKSIVATSAVGATTRYRMLPPIRHRGIVHLRDSGELLVVRRRHRDWCVRLAEQVAEQWMSSRQVDGMERLRRELGNINACLEFSWTEPGEADAGLSIGADLLEFGLADGVFRQGRLWFDRLLAHSPEPTDLRARALRTAGWWAAMQGDLDTAARQIAEGAAIARDVGGHTATLLTQAEAFLAMFCGDTDVARTKFETALAGFRESGDTSQQAHTLALMSLNFCFLGDLEAALDAEQQCLAVTEPVGESWYRSYALWIAGLAAWAGGDTAAGLDRERRSLELRQRTRDPLGIGTSVEAIAWMVVDRDPERAAWLLGGASAIWDRIETSTAALAGLHEFHKACEATARERLGEGFTEAFDNGRGVGEDALVAEALAEVTGVRSQPRKTRTAKQPKPAATSVLTPREREIAALVANGMSNKDIATTLVISKRTAETHVEHILTKLGFNNRNQITAWVSEEGRPTART